jgi:hypothetical protein
MSTSASATPLPRTVDDDIAAFVYNIDGRAALRALSRDVSRRCIHDVDCFARKTPRNAALALAFRVHVPTRRCLRRGFPGPSSRASRLR